MKTYLTILTICYVLFTGNIFAQCSTGIIELYSQQEVNDFPSNYPNCADIDGDINIGGSVANLDSLYQIISISGFLIIDGSNLVNLSGLHNLDSIGKGFYIDYSQNLTSLSGLDNLNAIGGGLSVASLPTFSSFSGLENLNSIGEDLSIGFLPALSDLSGLENLTFIGEGLDISYNENLTSLSGLENLNSIGGSLSIGSNENLMSLSGLENLVSIGGDLSMFSITALSNFSGLENLNSIGGDLSIPDGLTSLSGLENLNFIGRNLVITNNHDLVDFSGLENLNSIGRNLSFSNNDNFVDFSGLENLDSIGQNLVVNDNDNLVDFSGLENLRSIGGLSAELNGNLVNFSGLENLNSIGTDGLYLSENALINLEGLNNVTTIEGSLSIESCFSLTSLEGLNSLTTIAGSLQIIMVPSLSDISALSNLMTIGGILDMRVTQISDLSALENIDHTSITAISLVLNGQLSLCGVESICNFLIDGGIAVLEYNAEGCNTVAEIIQSCSSVWEYTVEGNIFMDDNNNCLRDASELGLDSWVVKVEGEQGTRYTYTYDNGKYFAPMDSGMYTVTPIPPNSLWEDVCFETDTAMLTSFNPRDTLDFGASTATFCPLLEIDITTPFIRRCFDSNYYVRYCNSGTAIAENAYVEVQLDPFFTYQSSTITTVDLGDNLYSFDLGNVDIGECSSFRIDVYVDCDSTVLGQTHCVEAHIYPDSICEPALPLWDGSSIKVDAQCLGDSIEFKIENIGVGDMSDSLEYIVVEHDLIWQRANFQLDSGENIKFSKQANGLFHRLEAEQSPGHPGNSMPSIFIEGCGENDNGEISLGFVNYYLLDEGDAFVSIDCQENVGAYDPNDKQAFPVGYGAPHYITDSTDLEYMIRFQNTGTDTAFNIVVRDTISPHLNIETLRPGVSSHDYRYDIEESNIAVFHFENIMLPDSNINEAASHGFIKFNIEQQRDNPIGTHIMNDAAIYFDFNEPIITNTIFHTVGEDFIGIITSIITPPEVEEAGISVNVFPNPFDEYARFEVQGKAVNELHLSVYDMMGREILQQKTTHKQHITMKRNNLTPGVYVFCLMDEKQQLATGKLVIE